MDYTVLPHRTAYYPIGNTPAVCLTQDLPPKQDADILLLGCGDVRNILFTCFTDSSRRIDVTCCDIEPGIHARNVLLYTLLIDDVNNCKIQLIWNIYYHLKIDKHSQKLLETQAQKLLQISTSADQWHSSAYGSSIRFCDERSLSSIRCYWSGFRSQDLSFSAKRDRASQLQAAWDRAKRMREAETGEKSPKNISGLRCTLPALNIEAVRDLPKIANKWWDFGTVTFSNASGAKPTELNPAFLFSPNQAVTIYGGTSPLHGFPLSTAYTPLSEESTANKCASSTQQLVDCAMCHFKQWASAFRRVVANKAVIRIFAGDALSFCLTLLNCHLTHSRSINLFCHSNTFSSLSLHSDYGKDNISAPTEFDIIDTSNLADHLGSLKVVPAVSSLLKHNVTSTLYTETLVAYDNDLVNRLQKFFGVDVSTMSLLLGLVLPDIFINATNSVDEDIVRSDVSKLLSGEDQLNPQRRSRLRWKRTGACHGSNNFPRLEMEAETLTKVLVQVHNTMFKHEDPSLLLSCLQLTDQGTKLKELSKLANPRYTRASFAFLLSCLKANITSNWVKCLKDLNTVIHLGTSTESSGNATLDLALNNYIFGVDDSQFPKPDPANLSGAILAPVLPVSPESVPDLLCITICVPRKQLRVFTNKKPWESRPTEVVLSFGGMDALGNKWQHVFSSPQLAFGVKHDHIMDNNNSYLYIQEDNAQLWGISDLFASIMVPTSMLLQSKQFVPIVECRLLPTFQNRCLFQGELGSDLCFSRNKLNSKDNVFITRFMPGMSAISKFSSATKEATSPTITVQLTPDLKIGCLDVGGVPLELEKPEFKLRIEFTSLMTAIFIIDESLIWEVKFPIPVCRKLLINTASSVLKITAFPFRHLDQETVFHLLPTFLMKTSSGTTVPALWTSGQVELDVLPVIDLHNKQAVSWLGIFVSQMFSAREAQIRHSQNRDDVRTNLKDVLFSLFMKYTGLQGQQTTAFALKKTDTGIQTLIFPACLRLDVANYTVVLDCALIPLISAMFEDPAVVRLIEELTGNGLCQIGVSVHENRAWKALMPALVERCRWTWEHHSVCEYLQSGMVPLLKGLQKDGELSICSCGFGKFPVGNYLKDQKKKFSDLNDVLNRFGIRAAISPTFAAPHVENCINQGLVFNAVIGSGAGLKMLNHESCQKCGAGKRKNSQAQQNLLCCSRCKKVTYCSSDCQKADWKQHKPFCKA